jgi:hypothetical protein
MVLLAYERLEKIMTSTYEKWDICEREIIKEKNNRDHHKNPVCMVTLENWLDSLSNNNIKRRVKEIIKSFRKE